MENSSVGAVPLIMSIVYLALTVYKSVVDGKEKFIRIIPVIASILGSILGIVAFYIVPGIMPAANPLSAILIGASSGLAATGTHQIVKLFSIEDINNILAKLNDNINDDNQDKNDDDKKE